MTHYRRIFLLAILLAAMTTVVRAQEFFHLDWTDFSRTGECPVASLRVPLDGGALDADAYDVRVEYPEYAPMTAAERRMMGADAATVGRTLDVSKTLMTSRKQRILEVTVKPIVRHGGRLQKLTSGRIVVKPRSAADGTGMARARALAPAASAKRYADHSVLATGRWAKIKVAEGGVYALTASVIRSLGFTNLDKIHIYGYGGLMQPEVIGYGRPDGHYDDLEEVPVLRRGSDILFYADGTLDWTPWTYNKTYKRFMSSRRFNPYATHGYYFITESDEPAAAMGKLAAVTEPPVETLTTFREHSLIEADGFSWLQSGRNQYDPYNFATGNSRNYTLPITDVAPNAPQASISWLMSAGASSTTRVDLSVDGVALRSASMSPIPDEYTYATTTQRIDTLKTVKAQSVLNIRTTAGNAAHLDYVQVNYTRRLRLQSAMMPFSYGQSGAVRFEMDAGGAKNVQIWRIGRPGSPMAQVPTEWKDGKLVFVLNDCSARYVAVNVDASFPNPQADVKIDNQDLHADGPADMVIIVPTSGKLVRQAQRLADYHEQHDGLRVRVVRADWLYNEFSSGTPNAIAYRKYMKMLYDRADNEADMPRYLLLFGDGIWDNRMLTSAARNLRPADYLLCYESDETSVSEINSYVTDDYFGLLDDGEGDAVASQMIDLGIGRLPVNDAAETQVVVDKLIAYMQGTAVGAWKNDVVVIADDGNSNSHMIDADTVSKNIEACHPELHVRRVYLDAYLRATSASGYTYPAVTALLRNTMRRGALVMNYSGHGAPYTISHERILNLSDFEDAASSNIPFWVVASCEVTPFDMLVQNIGCAAMLNPKGGAIGFFSSSRAAYATQNRYLNNNFMYYLLGRDANGRRYTVGDAARLAKVSLVSEMPWVNPNAKDYSSNKLKYALMGDPAMTLLMPTAQVVFDSIAGLPVGGSECPHLKAGDVVRVTGRVLDEKGKSLPAFHGSVSLALYDSRNNIVCHNNSGDKVQPYQYEDYTKTLYEGSDSVRQGRFAVEIPIPLDLNYSDMAGRLNAYAVNRERTIECAGVTTDFIVGGTVPDALADTTGPRMAIYLNDPTFRDGGVVNETPFFYAHLSDSDGINRAGIGVGHDIQLVIDGEETRTYVLNDYFENDFGSYCSGSIAFHIPELEAGEHQLYFRAWDMKNNASSAMLNFRVNPGIAPAITRIMATPNPASSYTTFRIAYDRPDCDMNLCIEVYDLFGRLCWEHKANVNTLDGNYQVTWPLTSMGGAELPSGLYIYKVSMSSAGGGKREATKKLVIRRQ